MVFKAAVAVNLLLIAGSTVFALFNPWYWETWRTGMLVFLSMFIGFMLGMSHQKVRVEEREES